MSASKRFTRAALGGLFTLAGASALRMRAGAPAPPKPVFNSETGLYEAAGAAPAPNNPVYNPETGLFEFAGKPLSTRWKAKDVIRIAKSAEISEWLKRKELKEGSDRVKWGWVRWFRHKYHWTQGWQKVPQEVAEFLREWNKDNSLPRTVISEDGSDGVWVQLADAAREDADGKPLTIDRVIGIAKNKIVEDYAMADAQRSVEFREEMWGYDDWSWVRRFRSGIKNILDKKQKEREAEIERQNAWAGAIQRMALWRKHNKQIGESKWEKNAAIKKYMNSLKNKEVKLEDRAANDFRAGDFVKDSEGLYYQVTEVGPGWDELTVTGDTTERYDTRYVQRRDVELVMVKGPEGTAYAEKLQPLKYDMLVDSTSPRALGKNTGATKQAFRCVHNRPVIKRNTISMYTDCFTERARPFRARESDINSWPNMEPREMRWSFKMPNTDRFGQSIQKGDIVLTPFGFGRNLVSKYVPDFRANFAMSLVELDVFLGTDRDDDDYSDREYRERYAPYQTRQFYFANEELQKITGNWNYSVEQVKARMLAGKGQQDPWVRAAIQQQNSRKGQSPTWSRGNAHDFHELRSEEWKALHKRVYEENTTVYWYTK